MADEEWPCSKLNGFDRVEDKLSPADTNFGAIEEGFESQDAHLSDEEGFVDSFYNASLFSEFDDIVFDTVTSPIEPYSQQFLEFSKFDDEPLNKIGNDDTPSCVEQQCLPLSSTELLEIYGSGFEGLRRESTAKPFEEPTSIEGGGGGGDKHLSTQEIMRIAAARFVQSNDSHNSNQPFGVSFIESELPNEVLEDVKLTETLLLSSMEVEKEQYDTAAKLLYQCDALSSNTGTPVQRVVFYFSQALWQKIHRKSGLTKKGLSITQPFNLDEVMMKDSLSALTIHEKLPFFQISQFVGIQAIVESMANAKKIHVIDLGIRTGTHWPILMQALAFRNGRPLELLKITAVGTCSMDSTDETGKRLMSFAAAMNIPFAFRAVMVTDMLNLNEVFFDIAFDEKVAVYTAFSLMCLISLPDRLDAFMNVIRNMKPRIMVVTEIDANLNSKSFVNRFTESLFFCSAFFDCIETFMARNDPQRINAEAKYFGQPLSNMLATEEEERSTRQVKFDVWRKYFARFGMMEMELSSSSLHQANILVQQFDCKSSLTIDRNGSCLILCWKGTPLFSLSVWNFMKNHK